jgi:hypothetical protein
VQAASRPELAARHRERRVPLDEIFIVPVRLTPCRVPRSIQRELQYVDLFPDWIDGLTHLVAMPRCEVERRAPAGRG